MNNRKWKLCEFGIEAEKLREERGIPKTELCRRIGISVTYYDYITHGLRPGIQIKPRILDELKMAIKTA